VSGDAAEEPLEESEEVVTDVAAPEDVATDEVSDDVDENSSSAQRYPTKGRGTMGVRDIKTTERNGPVVDIVSVREGDEVLVMTARGKLQRIAVSEIRLTGRNTQGVRIMNVDEGDSLAAVVRVPRDDAQKSETIEAPSPIPPSSE
jgi:DNA gyrase subunit A